MYPKTKVLDVAMLEHNIREDLKAKVHCVMAVLRPLKVVITNYPEGQVEWFDAGSNPENPDLGSREFLSQGIYIEREDYMENLQRDTLDYSWQ